MAYSRLHPNAIGSVITLLEMTERPALGGARPSSLRLRRWATPSTPSYRKLFEKVGGHWLWYERLALDTGELEKIIRSPRVEVHRVFDAAEDIVGFIEVDFREAGQCRIAYVGLLPALSGQGHGRWLLEETLRLAWRDGVERVHLNTCTLDHPAALPAYLRAGFRIYERAVGTFFDPRTRGLLPRHLAPHVPIIDGAETVPV